MTGIHRTAVIHLRLYHAPRALRESAPVVFDALTSTDDPYGRSGDLATVARRPGLA